MAPVTRRRRGNGRVSRPSSRQTENEVVELSLEDGKTCMFCGRKEICEKLYGPLYQLNGVIVHYFCILLSSRAVQNGSDKEGIWGFLLKDIKTELHRGSREICTYCKKPGATISCCSSRCQKIFHLPCGLDHGSMHQFFQTFKSFCYHHRITQNVDIQDLQQSTPVKCSMCSEDLIPNPTPSVIWAPCCKHNAWFHRGCVQDLALSSGYFFKCPLCNNVDVFKGRMLTLGIYIPSRDASWETVPNAYSELLERHNACDADKCLCPSSDGRNHYQKTGSWEIILCNACGSNGTHRLCSSLKHNEEWYCTSCSPVIEGKENPVCAKKRRLEVTGNQNNCISTTTQGEIINQTSQTNIVPRRNLGETSMNLTTRESTRRTRNSRNMSRCNMIVPQQVSEVISLISDEEDHTNEADDSNDSDNSDVQIITYVEPSNSVIPQVPILGSFASTSNFSASTSNRNDVYLLRMPPSSTQTRSSNHYSTETIDLTLDDN